MKLAIQLAWRNLIGAGLRTWLNVIVLSFSFVVIIWMKGIMTGWDHQARTDMTLWEIGSGQYWHEGYDPYDPMTLEESHAPVPEAFHDAIQRGSVEPVLIVQGTIFPEGRMMPVLIRGINQDQSFLHLPTHRFDTVSDAVPAIIGSTMAHSSRLSAGDRVIMRWRDAHGTFDAREVEIMEVFHCNVPMADAGQIYVPLPFLQEVTLLPEEATLLTFNGEIPLKTPPEGWVFKSAKELTRQIDEVIRTKNSGLMLFYIILLLLAMLAIFDSQVLSIFRRQREIGTYIALGYTRREVVGLFTVEGSMHAVMAAMAATVYGLPILLWQARVGWTMPVDTSQFGMSIAQTLYPVYTAGLVIGTILIVMVTTIIVSYLPSRKIAKMNPTEALRGKLQ